MSKKRNLVKLSIFLTLIFCIGGCSMAGFYGLFTKPISFNVDLTKPLTLDFGKAEVKVIKSSKDTVRIKPNEFTNSSAVKFQKNGNLIKFDNEAYLEKTPDTRVLGFHIYIPENLPLNIESEKVRIRHSTVLSTNASSAEVRECIVSGQFKGKGEYIYLREVKFDDNIILHSSKIEMRDNKLNNIVISSDNVKKVLMLK